MTQRERILYELRTAGAGGVRSDHFFHWTCTEQPVTVAGLRDAAREALA
jgi:hypothetical protein